MEIFLRRAVEIVKAQASNRSMTKDEIASMVRCIAKCIATLIESQSSSNYKTTSTIPLLDSKNAIKEGSIICLEC